LDCFQELFWRAVDVRVKRMEQGLNCPDLTPDLVASCWEPLRKEIFEAKANLEKAILPAKYDPKPDDFDEMVRIAKLKAKERFGHE
jgi:hypothetical protein